MRNGFWSALVGGVVLFVVLIPWVERSLENGDIKLNGLVVNFMDVVNEALSNQVNTPNPEE